MKLNHTLTTWTCLAAAIAAPIALGAAPRIAPTRPATTQPSDQPAAYTWRPVHDPDGIGKFFMGREIAQVMGHEGADWLERPEREREEAPALLMKSLRLRPGQVVCDLGAGSGYLTVRLARAVGADGRVKAVDVQPEMLALLKERLARENLHNVDLVLGTEKDPRLAPASVDLVLMVDVYHEFAFPHEMMRHIAAALRPGGRVVFVEYRKEDRAVPIKEVHKMSAAQVRREMRPHALTLIEKIDVLPRQHILVFGKRAPTTAPSQDAGR